MRDRILGSTCESCLNRRYLEAMLDRECSAWANVPYVDVALSRERGRLQHPVLKVDQGLTYCGDRATEGRNKRMRVKPDSLPAGVCTVCVRNFQRVQQRAAEMRRAKGVES